MIRFTIPLTPISKKNSQQILCNPRTGKPFIVPSKKYKEYEEAAGWFLPKGQAIGTAVNVKCLFYMPTRRRCDLTNMLEAVDDLLVKHGVLVDDNYTVVESHDGSRVLYDKEHPRTEVYITEAAAEDTQTCNTCAHDRVCEIAHNDGVCDEYMHRAW